MKQTLKIGFTVLVVAALTMSGFALAQSDQATTDQTVTDPTTAAQPPTAQPPADEVTRGVAAILERLAPLIEDRTISQEQAEAVAGQLADGFRPGAMHRPVRVGLETAADFLGMDVQDLAARLRDGATLAEIAGDQTDGLIAALVAEAEDHLAQAVADGRLTQAEAEERLADIEGHITTFVNEGLPERPFGGGHRPGGPDGGEAPMAGAEA